MDLGSVSTILDDGAVAATWCEYEANPCKATRHCTAPGEYAGYVLTTQASDTKSSSSKEYKHPQRELIQTTPQTSDGAQLKDDHSNVHNSLSWDLLFQPWPALANAAAAAQQDETPLITEILVDPSLVVIPAAAAASAAASAADKHMT